MKGITYGNIDLEKNYKQIILKSKKINIDEINNFLIDFNVNKSFEELILLPIEEIIAIKEITANEIQRKYNLSNEELPKKIKTIKSLFNYKEMQQHELSTFFMDHAEVINLNSCYYCNIDFVNTFVSFINEYFDKYDLVNNVESKQELLLINNIGDVTAEEIFALKGKILNETSYKTLLKTGTQKILNELFENGKISNNKLKNHSHFTLDHILPQNGFVHFSLSLYNLIPSCYSCNSKFKKDKKIYFDIKELIKISPSSSQFDENSFKINLNFNQGFCMDNVNKIDNYKIKINSKHKEFVKLLKLQGRYNFHKNLSFVMINKRKIYSDSEIRDIANLLGRDEKTVKEDLFGKECFESSNSPFEKYKQDIAQQLGLY
ncbi:hypothetical protein [Kaistella carnis]|uniref:hypothetical protein n=1 Tax=Kaistella carnis TaxID=1241979 RepID=UPI0028A9E42D|nr:hypothetical protein [Kaistella carnis]